MKNTGRIVLLLTLVLTLGTSAAHAQAKNLKKVEELLVTMGMEDSVNSAVTQMLYDLFVSTPEFDMHQDLILAYAEERVSWDVLKDNIVEIYAAEFTDTEIAELTRFYTSKIGKKLIKVTPDMSSRVSKVVKERYESDLDVLEMQMKDREMDLLEEEVLFFKDEAKE